MEQEVQSEIEQSEMFDESAANLMIDDLDDLDDDSEGDYEPPSEEELINGQNTAKTNEVAVLSREGQAKVAVMGALHTYELLIKAILHKRYVLDKEERENLAEAVVPVIIKWVPEDEDIGGWIFTKFEAEIKAGTLVYMLATGTISQIKELKQEDKAIGVKSEREPLRAQIEEDDEREE